MNEQAGEYGENSVKIVDISSQPRVQTTESARDERVSTILSDRPCTKCFFNLAGQPVVRERHYGMLISRCPECGTAAAIQEYPHLTRWSRRLIALLAAAWGLALVLGVVLTGMTIGGMSNLLMTDSAEALAIEIAKAHKAYRAEHPVDPAITQEREYWYNDSITPYASIDQDFINSRPDMELLFARAGGWRGVWKPSFLITIFGSSLTVFVMSVIWSVVMPHCRWKRRAAVDVCAGRSGEFSVVCRGHGDRSWNRTRDHALADSAADAAENA